MRGIESMAYPLPEDIQVRVHAGDFKGALGLIDIYIREGIAPLLNQRLELEKQRMERMSANLYAASGNKHGPGRNTRAYRRGV